jgi:hypothetical protein
MIPRFPALPLKMIDAQGKEDYGGRIGLSFIDL